MGINEQLLLIYQDEFEINFPNIKYYNIIQF